MSGLVGGEEGVRAVGLDFLQGLVAFPLMGFFVFFDLQPYVYRFY